MTSRTNCPSCNNEVPPGMPTCGWCGARLAAAGESNTVNVHAAERRLFGVPPATGLLLAGCLAVALAVFFLLTGRLLVGLIVLILGLLLLAAFPAIARRPDESTLARRTVRSYDGLRERADAMLESLAARAEARRRLTLLAREIEQLEHSRTEGLHRLGEAAYAENEPEIERLRTEIAAADAALESKRAQAERVHVETDERLDEARLRAQPTQRLPRTEGLTAVGAAHEPADRSTAARTGSPERRQEVS